LQNRHAVIAESITINFDSLTDVDACGETHKLKKWPSLARDLVIGGVSVRLSVCYRMVLTQNQCRGIMRFSPPGSQVTKIFDTDFHTVSREHPYTQLYSHSKAAKIKTCKKRKKRSKIKHCMISQTRQNSRIQY